MTDYSQFEFDMDDLARHAFGSLPAPSAGEKVKLGVCAMPKKAKSKPMREILGRLDPDEFEIVHFPEDTIMNQPIEEWPLVHSLISFFSDGFPLEKAEAYVELRKPFMVNELKPQHLLKDRRHVLKLMEKFGVPTPDHVVVNRDSSSPSGFPVEVNKDDDMQEFDDYIVVNGKRMDKPFVEKPVDGDDHNVYIYYPRSAGGGSCRLFRKVKDRSSEFYPNENNVRRTGSFIYEAFLRTEGSDVKVYTVTAAYAHSEARKSPSIDGVVSRNENGFEVRYPILLNSMEKEIANRIIMATGQRICGFDVLRSDSMSYVCDVNGWSFVKNNHKYYDDFALILSDLIRRAMGLTQLSVWPGSISGSGEELTDSDSETEEHQPPTLTHSKHSKSGHSYHKENDVHEELRCVIAVVRHGDRTPKQKLKISVQDQRILNLFDKYGNRHSKEELKLKSAAQLGWVLKIIVDLINATEKARGRDLEDSDCEERDIYDLLLQARSVLEMHGTFKGINRKVQLKPTEWDEDGKITEAQFILKWGGVLTLSGRQQAEYMGQSFRQKLYPFDGLLRLHSTYRHDLKIYSSNEGRVQVTAAAFAKGMLQLEGHLTPILTSLVRKSSEVDELLDDASDAKQPIDVIKKRLHMALLNQNPTPEELRETIASTDASSVLEALEFLEFNPRKYMKTLHDHITRLVAQLRICVKEQRARFGINTGRAGVANTGKLLEPDDSTKQSEGGSAAASLDRVEADRNLQSIVSEDSGTALLMCLYRWAKLEKDFYQKKKDNYDLSKIPDINDSVKFDLLHNPQLMKLKPSHLQSIFEISTALADAIVPQEYGISPSEKKSIGSRIAKALVGKIQTDLVNTVNYCTRSEKKQNLRRDPSVATMLSSSASHADYYSTASVVDSGASDSDSNETFHRLDKRHARSLGIKSSDRMVRTRLYFTSESHLHSLLSVLRYAAAETVNVSPEEIEMDLPSVSQQAEEALKKVKELNYLTHIVFRLFEITPKKRKDGKLARKKSRDGPNSSDLGEPSKFGELPKRFRISVGISPGVAVSIDADGKVHQGELDALNPPAQPGDGTPTEASAPKTLTVKSSSTNSFIVAEPEGSAYGSKADIQLLPCSSLIPLWKDLELNLLNNLFTRVLRDVNLELETASLGGESAAPSSDLNSPPNPMDQLLETQTTGKVAQPPPPPSAKPKSKLQRNYSEHF